MSHMIRLYARSTPACCLFRGTAQRSFLSGCHSSELTSEKFRLVGAELVGGGGGR